MNSLTSLQTAISCVLPLFIYMTLGVIFRKIKLVSIPTFNELNRLAFKIFLSVSLYYNIITADLKEAFDAKLVLFAVIAQFAALALGLFIALITEKNSGKKKIGALAHGIFHTNFVIFGTVIGTALLGEGNLGSISILIALIVPIQNILSVILLECFRENSKINVKSIVLSVLKNPYVIAAILGFLTQLIGFTWPSVLKNVIRDLGRCGTPVALIVMGGLFKFGEIKNNIKPIITGVVSRLILMPCIMVPIALKLGFTGAGMIGLMTVFIAPCATTSFNLASAMDSDADLAAQLVVFTSLVSIVTIFAWIFVLSQLGVLAV